MTATVTEPTRRISRTRVERKETPSQIPYALVLLIVVVAFGYYLADGLNLSRMSVHWGIGILLGLTLQRARLCFTAALRDPMLTGGTNATKAVMIGLAVGTVGFVSLQLSGYLKANNIADAIKLTTVEPMGIYTVVGGILFGIGAVIAGGCASGTLMRIGEGFIQQWLVLPFFVLGSVIGVATWPFWKVVLMVDLKADAVYLPHALGGFVPALVVQFGLLFGAWLLADWWGKRKTGAQ